MKKLLYFAVVCFGTLPITVSDAVACDQLNDKAVRVVASDSIENTTTPAALPEENQNHDVTKAEDNANTKSDEPAATFTLNKTGLLPEYVEGETVTITVSVKQPGYPSVFGVDCQGGTVCLYPNKYVPKGIEAKLEANDQFTIPDKNANFLLKVQAPFGIERIYLVLTPEPIDPSLVGAKSFLNESVTPVNSTKLKQVIPVLKKKAFVTSIEIKTVPKSEINTDDDSANKHEVSLPCNSRADLSQQQIRLIRSMLHRFL
ncbi:MAG: DUF4384 domain-containing protein [Planctomycetaceae bacterium]|jgi:hypothetical protein|nr:DUF4384 domain-containing protein [Planctomycetaceae bacterium]